MGEEVVKVAIFVGDGPHYKRKNGQTGWGAKEALDSASCCASELGIQKGIKTDSNRKYDSIINRAYLSLPFQKPVSIIAVMLLGRSKKSCIRLADGVTCIHVVI